MLRITSSTIVVLALSACVAEPDESTTEHGITGCPKWGCGENSPVMGPYGFHELNVDGLANAEHVRIINFQIGAKIYKPRINNGSDLVVYDPVTNASISGSGLTGGWFNIATPREVWKIFITKVNQKNTSNVKFWLGPPSQIETYELSYSGPSGVGRLCANPPNRDSGEGGKIWEAPLEAIFYTGDRYDVDAKTVTASTYASTAGWFNIACAGSALAKLHLNRHTTAGTTFNFATSASQRQAMLKMYVSDICGTGDTFTQKGVPLHWQNTGGWSLLNGFEFAFEARWTANGAACLDTHRLGDLYMKPGDPESIPSVCGQVPPPCNGSVSAPTFNGAYLVTAVPHDPNP